MLRKIWSNSENSDRLEFYFELTTQQKSGIFPMERYLDDLTPTYR